MKTAAITFALGLALTIFVVTTGPLAVLAVDAARAAKWTPAALVLALGVILSAIAALAVGIAKKRGAFACIAVMALLMIAPDADAGCRRGRHGGCSGGSCGQSSSNACQLPGCGNTSCPCGAACACTNCVCEPQPVNTGALAYLGPKPEPVAAPQAAHTVGNCSDGSCTGGQCNARRGFFRRR